MKYLIDGQAKRIELRREQWNSGVAGQLLTPLTRYRLAADVFAVDNGAFTNFDQKKFDRLLLREQENVSKCLFVALPDVVGNHKRTLEMYSHFARSICLGVSRLWHKTASTRSRLVPTLFL